MAAVEVRVVEVVMVAQEQEAPALARSVKTRSRSMTRQTFGALELAWGVRQVWTACPSHRLGVCAELVVRPTTTL